MAHGHPDYGTNAPVSTVYKLQDMAELAVRLGGIHAYDRRGNVVWWDDFEESIASWSYGNYGTGAASGLGTDERLWGVGSLKLTAGSDGAAAVKFSRRFPVQTSGKFGFELHVKPLDDFDYMLVGLNRYDGETKHRTTIYHVQSSLQHEYTGNAGSNVVIATAPTWQVSGGPFHAMKVVADFELDEYVRALFDHTEYDLSGVGAYLTADATPACYEIEFQWGGRAGNNDIGWVDTVIFTQNEP